MLFDMRTIVFSNMLTNVICLAVIIFLWRQNRGRFPGLWLFVLDFVLQTAALLLIILRGGIPSLLSIVVANTFVVAGALSGYIGLEAFTAKRSSQIHNYLFLAAFASIHYYFTSLQPDQGIRNVNLAVGLLIICFQCAWLLLHRVERGIRQETRVVGIIFVFYCLLSIARISEFFISTTVKPDYLHSGIFEQLILIFYQLLFISLTYGITLMINGRLITDIKTEEEKFSKAFHSSPYAITLTRLSDGQIIEVNKTFFKISGYQPEDLQGKTTIDMRLWDNEEDRFATVDELMRTGKVQGKEFQFRGKAGNKIAGVFSAETFTIKGEIIALSSINDITKRKQAEEELEKTARQWQTTFDATNDAIWILDKEQRVIRSNKTAERFFHRPYEEFIGKQCWELVHGTRQPIPECPILRAKHSLRRETMELQIGDSWFGITVDPILDEKNNLVGFVHIVSDITERKQAEDEIKRLYQEMESSVNEKTKDLYQSQLALLNVVDDLNENTKKLATTNQSLGALNKELEAFAYSVSHDLRAPLRSIDGFSAALLEDYKKKLDKTGENYLQRIRLASQRMGLLIDDLLKLSRVARSEFHAEIINLSEMAQEIVQEYKKNTSGKTVEIVIQEGIIAQGDPHLLRIALTNLIENAWKFTGKQKNPLIEFGTTLNEGKNVFFIRDNGVGLRYAYVGKLFGAFQRLHNTDEFPGTGIGLATVQRIIHRHRGKIWAKGEVGKGAVFYFTIP